MKHSLKTLSVILLAVTVFFTYRYYAPMEKINIDGNLTRLVNKYLEPDSVESKFPFCEIVPVKDFDRILVAGPYCIPRQFNGFNISNFGRVKWVICTVSYQEGKCALIYMKNDRAVAYSIVSRMPVDPVILNKGVYAINRSDCEALCVRKQGNEYGLFIKKR